MIIASRNGNCPGEPESDMRDEPSLRRQWLAEGTFRPTPGPDGPRGGGRTGRHRTQVPSAATSTCFYRGLGFPLEETVGEYGRKTWRIRDARDQPPLSFSFDEAIALFTSAARCLLEPLAGTLFWEAAQHRVPERSGPRLGPGRLSSYIDRFAAVFHQTAASAPTDYSRRTRRTERRPCRSAIEDGKRGDFACSTGPSTRTAPPTATSTPAG